MAILANANDQSVITPGDHWMNVDTTLFLHRQKTSNLSDFDNNELQGSIALAKQT